MGGAVSLLKPGWAPGGAVGTGVREGEALGLVLEPRKAKAVGRESEKAKQ